MCSNFIGLPYLIVKFIFLVYSLENYEKIHAMMLRLLYSFYFLPFLMAVVILYFRYKTDVKREEVNPFNFMQLFITVLLF